MSKNRFIAIALGGIFALVLLGCKRPAAQAPASDGVFNIRDFGATGIKEDLAQEAIQAGQEPAAEGTRNILLERNDYRKARLPYGFAGGASAQALKLGY